MKKTDVFRKRADELVSQLTLSEKLDLLSTHMHEVKRLGIDEFNIGTEAARGFVGRDTDHRSTVFPQPVGLAGTFDRELMRSLGRIAAKESRAYYNSGEKTHLCLWGPTVDMERDPRWGRTEEAYGEDVCLAGEMTAAYTLGMTGDDDTYVMTVPTLKHFCANNNENERMDCNAFLPPRLKYEYYYAAFMNAIKYGGAKSVMTAYNEINGIPALCNPDLDSVLKKQWGMWFAVTDGGDFSQTVTLHGYTDTHSEALAEALKAGCDVMTDDDKLTRLAAEKALEDGLITEADIDRSVRNTLYARLRLGQFDKTGFDSIGKEVIGCKEHLDTTLRAAREQVVLLKNDGLLPLKKKTGRIAVAGPLADEVFMDWYTGYSHGDTSVYEGVKKEFPDCDIVYDSLWDTVAVKASNGKYITVGEDGFLKASAESISDAELFELQDWGENWISLFSLAHRRFITIGKDLKLAVGKEKTYGWFPFETFNIFSVPYDDGKSVIEDQTKHKRVVMDENGNVRLSESRNITDDVLFSIETVSSGKERAEKLAEECETFVYCTGNCPMQVARECYDRKTLSLDTCGHKELYTAIHERCSDMVMVLVSSYPYAINDEDRELPAIVYTTHAGPYLGKAVAETLSGRNVPAGRLALTWYRSELDLPDRLDYDIEKSGATYMYFRGKPLYPFGYGLSYADIRYVSMSAEQGSVSVTLRNLSDFAAAEAVQVYFTVENSAFSRPVRKLCAFERVHLEAGQELTVKLTVPEHILQVYDVRSGRMMTEKGKYRFYAGGSSADLPLEAELFMDGEEIAEREDSFEAMQFDDHYNIFMGYSKKQRRHYITTHEWCGSVTFRNIPYSELKSIMVTASSIYADRTMYLDIGGIKKEMTINASNSYDDFSWYEIEIPEGEKSRDDILIIISDGMCIQDVRYVRK